jgi:hypothetical protein
MFRDPHFLRALDQRATAAWNAFFQVMWGMLARDPQLCQQCIDLDFAQVRQAHWEAIVRIVHTLNLTGY